MADGNEPDVIGEVCSVSGNPTLIIPCLVMPLQIFLALRFISLHYRLYYTLLLIQAIIPVLACVLEKLCGRNDLVSFAYLHCFFFACQVDCFLFFLCGAFHVLIFAGLYVSFFLVGRITKTGHQISRLECSRNPHPRLFDSFIQIFGLSRRMFFARPHLH